jgi:hypothetical protein
MTHYTVPRNSNPKVFRIFAYTSVGLVLIVLGLSRLELDDRVSHAIGWSAGGLLVVGILGVFVLIFRDGIDKFWQKASFDMTDDKIICLFEGRPPREFLLREITSIGESRTGLLVQTKEPSKGFFIPRTLDHFEQLKQQLSEQCQVTPVQNPASPVPILPLLLLVGLYAFFFAARTGVLVLIAGVVALLFQGWWIFSMRKIWVKTPSPKLLMSVSIFSWLVLLWVVYQRVSSTL